MPTQFFLALTIVLFVIAIKRESQAKSPISAASWITFIWVVLASIRPISSFLYPGQSMAFQQFFSWEQGTVDLIQSNPLERNMRIALMIVGLIILYKRRNRFTLHFGENAWICLFYLYTLVSIGWAVYPAIAFKRWIRLAGDAVIALLLLTEDDSAATLERIVWRTAAILLPLSLFLVKFSDRLGRIYTPWGTQMWVGVAGHKNSLGELCAYTGIVLVWRCLKRWPKVDGFDALLLAIAGYLLVGSRCSTASIVLLVGLVLLMVQSRMKGNIRKFNRVVIITLLSVLILQGLAIVFFNSSLAPMLFSAAGRDTSFTGRVPLWLELINIGLTRPLWGFGYTSFWLDREAVTELYEKLRWTPTTTHNGYLEIFMNLGLVGLLSLMLLLKRTYKNIMMTYEEDPDFGRLKVVIFTMIVLHNFTESTLGMPNALLWLLLLFSAIVVRTKTNKESNTMPESALTFSADL
jgi:O-antigen ligase